MFGRYLLFAVACVAASFTEGRSECVNATWGIQKGFKTTLRPVIMKADVTHEVFQLEFPGLGARLGGCDQEGSSASACFTDGGDVSLHFMSQFSLFVTRTNAATDLKINSASYCGIS